MQHDKDNNCYYCGYGPQNLSPNWSNGHSGICFSTHSDDPPENAKNKKEWQKFKILSHETPNCKAMYITARKASQKSYYTQNAMR
jgi:hypothetical protein